MKKLIYFLLIATSISYAQSDAKAQYATFKTEFETYRDNPEVSSENSTIKPAPCGQYSLKFMITAKSDSEIVTTPPARKLCYDLVRFDKEKNPDISKDWTYEIVPVGNKYYVITAQKSGSAAKELYYYERAEKK